MNPNSWHFLSIWNETEAFGFGFGSMNIPPFFLVWVRFAWCYWTWINTGAKHKNSWKSFQSHWIERTFWCIKNLYPDQSFDFQIEAILICVLFVCAELLSVGKIHLKTETLSRGRKLKMKCSHEGSMEISHNICKVFLSPHWATSANLLWWY